MNDDCVSSPSALSQTASVWMPPVWTSYVTVDDLEATVAKVEPAGGTVLQPPMDVMDAGRMAVIADGRQSVTGYRVRERFPAWTLLEVDLVTGRTHQIRVHLAALGHPVAGDPVYGTGTARRGPDGLGRLFLHAWRIAFATPSTGDLVRLEAALPSELEAVLADLRAGAADRPTGPLDEEPRP